MSLAGAPRARVWIALSALWLALFAAAAALPLRWSWGLAYAGVVLPRAACSALLGLGVVALLVGWLSAGWNAAPAPPKRSIRREPSAPAASPGISSSWILPLAALAGGLFWLLRGQTHFLGDGDNRLFVLGDPRGVFKAPLDYLVNLKGSLLLGHALGGGLGEGQALVSVLSGAATLLLLPGLLRGAGVPEGRRLGTGAVFLLSGWTLLFFGYLEAYPVYLAALLFFLWLSFRLARAGAASLVLIPLWIILLGLHCQGLLMLPAVAYAVATGLKRGKWPGWILLAAVALASLGLSAIRVGPYALADHAFGVPGFLWSVFVHSGSPKHGVAHVGSALFAVSRLNELALVWGPSVTWLVFLWPGVPGKSAKKREPPAPETIILGIAALGGLGALVYSGTVGAARDWDLLAPSLVPAQLLFLGLASQRMDGVWRTVLPAGLVLGLLHLAPWVWIQVSPDAGSRWAGLLAAQGPAVLRLTPHNRVDVSEWLARQGKFALAGDILEGAEPDDPAAPKLRRSAGRLRLATRNPVAAARDYEIVYRTGFRATGLQGLANVFVAYPGNHILDESLEDAARRLARVDSAGLQQNWERVLGLTGEGLSRRPGEPLLLRRQSYALLSMGLGEEAVAAAKASIVGDSTDAGGWESLAVVLEQLGRRAEAARARARISTLEAPGAEPGRF